MSIEEEKNSYSISIKTEGTCVCKECKLSKRIPHKIPLYAPYTKRDLNQGDTLKWCSCGKSSHDPYCDNSCEDEILTPDNTDGKFTPVTFTLKKQQNIYSICGCKYTKSPPFCDGSHAVMNVNPKTPPCKCNIPEW